MAIALAEHISSLQLHDLVPSDPTIIAHEQSIPKDAQFSSYMTLNPLVEGVGASSPPGKEDGKADSLDNLGKDANANGVDGSLLNEDLGDILCTVSYNFIFIIESVKGKHTPGADVAKKIKEPR